MVVLSGAPSDLHPISKDVGILPTVDVCIPLDIPDIAFPRQGPVEGERDTMAYWFQPIGKTRITASFRMNHWVTASDLIGS